MPHKAFVNKVAMRITLHECFASYVDVSGEVASHERNFMNTFEKAEKYF